MRFAIVTTSLNPGCYLNETLQSVLTQTGDFCIAYHVQDAGSTDGTVELLKSQLQELQRGNLAIKCREVSFSYAIEPDQGMYDGINRGFRKLLNNHQAVDAMLWINADDKLTPDALARVFAYLNAHPAVDWLIGRTIQIDENGKEIANHPSVNVRNQDIAMGKCDGITYPYITQEACVWRLNLWTKCGELDARLKFAGDFEYWQRAARAGFNLHSTGLSIGMHRKRPGQLSEGLDYKCELDLIKKIKC